MKTLSIRQPWAHLILSGIKRVENRSWITSHRGPLIIHAAQRCEDFDAIERQFGIRIPRDVPCGGIVGRVELVDIVERSNDPYFCGPFGWILRDPETLPFRAMPGRLGLFNVNL
jgi:ASCH domain-containing protein